MESVEDGLMVDVVYVSPQTYLENMLVRFFESFQNRSHCRLILGAGVRGCGRAKGNE